ncbi:MAG TPA: LPS export ABC transporter periplasmic protein LptC [Bacteroidales bacterium]|nr:LPS export ABC transporter periplasmic protein LptC [Bacteroidales bacterium]HPS63514.1 LPS export ABC transporter periplasmic protein LptC [Bacteroidales bacterium]
MKTIPGLLFLLWFLAACSKPPQPNAAIRVRQNDPLMTARNITMLFSDSGQLQARLTSPLMNRYGGEDSYSEFPDGFHIVMFGPDGQITSTITGNRGTSRDRTRIMEAWGNVVVRNESKNEQMGTEHLVWEEGRNRIWSDVKVKITRPDQVLYGSRMESNESFTRYSIGNPAGTMAVKKDSI